MVKNSLSFLLRLLGALLMAMLLGAFATNGITSSKLPRRMGPKSKTIGTGQSLFEGDPILERGNSKMNRIDQVQSAGITGITDTDKIELLREAGINVRGPRPVRNR